MDHTRPPETGRWLTAHEVADLYGVTVWWVYDNKARIGFTRLGNGPRSHIRFHSREVEQFMTQRVQRVSARPRSRARKITRQTVWEIRA